jgi:phage shock protein C
METTTTHRPAAGSDRDTRVSTRQQLYRPARDRMLAGVASGVARYLGIDATVVRIIFALLAVVGGLGVPLYLAGWLLIPDEESGQSIASTLIDSAQSRSR